jgi:hypothetical protein
LEQSSNPKPRIVPFRAGTVVVAASFAGARHKIFQIKFSKADGSLFVNFPYFKNSKGILGIVTMPAGATEAQINLASQGKCTSHRVKYSHHPSGRAHFSQDGKIITLIYRQSVPLSSARGHLFTVQVQGIEGFDMADQPKDLAPPSDKRVNLKFNFSENCAIKFVAWQYRGPRLLVMAAGPPPDLLPPRTKEGFIIGSPYPSGKGSIIELTARPIPRFDHTHDSVLTFIGGFDTQERAADPNYESSFLGMMYPADNFEELAKRVGTVDRPPTTPMGRATH